MSPFSCPKPTQPINCDVGPTQPRKEESQSSLKNSHILIIDDDVEVTESIRQALNATGYSVSVALDGNKGLTYT
jgi:PleD family two-component response regulator